MITERAAIRAAGLVYASDEQPGFSRVRRGRGFSYHDATGARITDPEQLERIHALAVPPAYRHVWICRQANGHLQATGRDARGRKQYRYHPQWRRLRDQDKFERVLAFADGLPRLRRRVRRDLARSGLPADKVLAVLAGLLDETLIRVGNEEYVRANRSYGLTTLRTRHVRSERNRLRFVFKGKSGQTSDVLLDDRRLIRIVRRMQQLPGQHLFQYLDDEGRACAVDSGMLNDYLRRAAAGDAASAFSAKDFRTWGATVLAAGELAATALPDTGSARRRQLVATTRNVAAALRNTPAVCRASYIHPQVFEGWLDGSLQHAIPATAANHPRQLERLTLRFLKRARRARHGTRRGS